MSVIAVSDLSHDEALPQVRKEAELVANSTRRLDTPVSRPRLFDRGLGDWRVSSLSPISNVTGVIRFNNCNFCQLCL
jgi:hypothetical protein